MTLSQSERALILAPIGRDATVATAMLTEIGVSAHICQSIEALKQGLEEGAGFAVITEETLRTADLTSLSAWIEAQPEWSDMPFVLLTSRGDGLERNPAATLYLELLGNVTFLERPFHPTTFVSIAKSAQRTRRRQYEARTRLEALHESERQFRALADSIPTVCWIANPDGHVSWYNQQLYDYAGTTAEQMKDGWRELHDPDILPQVTTRWQASLESGELFEMVFPLRGADGKYRPFLARSQPVYDANGKIVRWFGTATNIEAQRQAEAALAERATELERRVEERTAEREEALAQLHEAQKLEMLGQLTGGVAHDFNNLLTPITGVLDLLLKRCDEEDSRDARLIGGALQSADRAKTLVQRLLGFARRQTLQTSAVDISRLIDNMRELIASSVGPNIELHVNKGSNLPPALADPNQLELAILNLCVNARDAMPGGGSLTLSLDRATIGPGESAKLKPGLYLRLSVLDTGIGMDPETLRRAIEPFFSTKEVGKGTGLGLSMIHGLAAQLGGNFELSSVQGRGTRADLWLQVARQGDLAAPAQDKEEPISVSRPLRILLVDDEDLVRIGTAEMLRELGHEVVETSNGAEALEIIAGDNRFDAIVTDYMMPRMDGAELARRIADIDPDMPILLITGYTDSTDLDPDMPRLAKPFRQANLAACLKAAIDKGNRVVRFPQWPRKSGDG